MDLLVFFDPSESRLAARVKGNAGVARQIPSLVEVEYPAEDALAARAVEARARRKD